MKRLALLLLVASGMAALSGCSQGTAATVQNPPARPAATASLAPLVDNVSDAPVRIPEGRKTPPAAPKSSSTPAQAKSNNDGDESKIIQQVSLEQQGRQQEKGGNRRNGNGTGNGKEGVRFEGRPQDKQRIEKAQEAYKQYALKKEQASKSSSDEKPAATPPVVPVNSEQTSATSDSQSGTAATPPPSSAAAAPVASGSATTSSNTTSSASNSSSTPFPVTFGSASNASSRSYKKPAMPSNLPGWFTENDKDGDGQLSMNEWPSDRFEEFTKYDRNGDAIITIEEAMRTVPKAVASTPAPSTTAPAATAPAAAAGTAAATPPAGGATALTAPAGTTRTFTFGPGGGGTPAAPGAPLSEDDAKRRVEMTFTYVDTNKDGILDEKEIENSRTIKSLDWKKYDANKDGKLDRNEAIALFKVEGNNMRGGGGMGGMAGRSPDEMAKVMFDNMDRSKTGKIAKDNFPGFLRDRFADFDTNKDGFVDFEEFKANRDKMMPQRGGPGGGRGPGGGGDGGGRGGQGGRQGGFGGGGNGNGGGGDGMRVRGGGGAAFGGGGFGGR